MIDGYPRILTIIAAVGAGVSGGVFFAFSAFVIKALGRLPAAQGISAMNAINTAAPTPPFMLALFGTAAVCIALSVAALRHLDQRWAAHLLIGSALYLTCVVLTIAYHVPRNNALALVDPAAPGAAHAWAQYLSSPLVVDSVEPRAHHHGASRHHDLHPCPPGAMSASGKAASDRLSDRGGIPPTGYDRLTGEP